MEALPTAVLGLAGSEEGESAFVDGPALWVNGKEVFHADREGGYDVRLTRAVIREHRDRLRGEAHVELRPSSSSDWIRVAPGDDDLLAEMVALAVTAHRAAPGATPVPPPIGADLARRRRFH